MVLGLMAIIAVIAMPAVSTWLNNAVYRDTAQDFIQALRQARALAVSTNLEHRVDFEVSTGRYRLLRGERANGSPFAVIDPVINWAPISNKVALRATDGCDSTANKSFEFNPNGTSANGTICIVEADNPAKIRYRISVNQNTGRAAIQ